MPSFRCKIGTSDGRVIEREFEADRRELLRESLVEQGFFVFAIRRRFQLPGRSPLRGGFGGRRFLSFNQELLVLIRSGLPIIKVLDTLLERMEPGRLLEVLREIREDVRGGSIISEAFGKFPQFFPHLYVASIRAGERTGDLPVTLTRYIAYQKRVEAIKAKVRSASFYPILITIAVVAVVLFMLLYVVPTFTQIYGDAQIELPLITQLLILTAEGLTKGLPILIPLAVAAFLAVRFLLSTEKGKLLFDRWKLKAPFFGTLQIDYALTGFCRTFSTTLVSGIPIVQAMQMSRGTLNNLILEGKLTQSIRRVEEGTALSAALEQAGFFPLLALRMIGVGETTGALSDMLNDVADYYEAELERRLDRLTTMIEPLMMVGMGLLVAGIVVAMYIPIFQLAGTAAR
ncbi:MAG: type II secretion system F family protein [Desulfuromonadales bacterium]|nr:type II secretion system F family protein [Desulfuromonadales bacterium]